MSRILFFSSRFAGLPLRSSKRDCVRARVFDFAGSVVLPSSVADLISVNFVCFFGFGFLCLFFAGFDFEIERACFDW